MRRYLINGWQFIISVTFVFAPGLVAAQTTANGPYYATPSWDQQLPAVTRFVVLSNWGGAAVLDRETGLVWEKSPDAIPRTWADAQRSCVMKEVGGRSGWKLPSIQELASLIDRTASNPALPAGHPFANVQSSFYWSATTLAFNSNSAWIVSLAPGVVTDDVKPAADFVWCVRGGPGGEFQ